MLLDYISTIRGNCLASSESVEYRSRVIYGNWSTWTSPSPLSVFSLMQDSRFNWNESVNLATMDATQNLCQELVDDIIGYLHDDKAILRACSLTPRAMVAAVQRGLFSEICVWPRPRGPDPPHGFTIQRLVEVVNTHPHVATYVKSLYITFEPTNPEIMTPHIFEFTGVLLKFSQISRFSLDVYPLADFDSMKLLPFFLSIPLVLRCPTLSMSNSCMSRPASFAVI